MSVHAPSKPVQFRMPNPANGIVRWSATGYAPWYPAAVTEQGDQAIRVAVLVPNTKGLYPRDGVRHVADPNFAKQSDQSGGVWDFIPIEMALNTVIIDHDELVKRVTQLEAEIVQLKQSLGA